MRIDLFTYYILSINVEGLHLQPDDVTRAVVRLLDPDGAIGLSAIMVSRVRRAFVSREAAEGLANQLSALGLSREIEECEEILTHGINQQAVRQEVERRRALGGELHHIEFPEAYARNVLEGYDVQCRFLTRRIEV